MNGDGAGKGVRKYVVGKKNSAAPVLRIPHEHKISIHTTIKPTTSPQPSTFATEIAPHDFQLAHKHQISIPHATDRKPRALATTPIQPPNQQSPSQAATANIIRHQIQRMDDPNRAIIEREKLRQAGDVSAKLQARKFAFHSVADAVAQKRAALEAQRKYHAAWRSYYQQYYEHYYRDEMARQEAEFQEQIARKPANQPNEKFSRNYLGAAAGKATALAQRNNTKPKSEVDQLRSDILSRVKKSAKKARKSRHFIPAIAALFVVLVVTFLQFNGVIFATIANFVSPGSTSGQSIIVGTDANEPINSSDTQVIIPKINVQASVQYGLTDLSEEGAQAALQNGPIHYPLENATAVPGQKGNTVVLGHSSADWFAAGNFKFIFVQLNRMDTGDLFYLDYQGARYTYRVIRTQIIAPTNIGAFNLGTDEPYATLVTCDPPGTATNRLLIIGQQISPDPNTTATTTQTNISNGEAKQVTGNPSTLLEKIFGGK